MLICGFGCAALGELVPQIVPVAKYIGAAYVLYLAYKTLIRKTGSGTADASQPLTCGNGFLLQFLNIKILMLGIAFYSGYILPYGFYPGHIVAFALVMALCAAPETIVSGAAFLLTRQYSAVQPSSVKQAEDGRPINSGLYMLFSSSATPRVNTSARPMAGRLLLCRKLRGMLLLLCVPDRSLCGGKRIESDV